MKPSQEAIKLKDPYQSRNGRGAGWMPVFRIFQFQFKQRIWVEIDPVSGQETPVDREDILDDLDIRGDEEEENGSNQR